MVWQLVYEKENFEFKQELEKDEFWPFLFKTSYLSSSHDQTKCRFCTRFANPISCQQHRISSVSQLKTPHSLTAWWFYMLHFRYILALKLSLLISTLKHLDAWAKPCIPNDAQVVLSVTLRTYVRSRQARHNWVLLHSPLITSSYQLHDFASSLEELSKRLSLVFISAVRPSGSCGTNISSLSDDASLLSLADWVTIKAGCSSFHDIETNGLPTSWPKQPQKISLGQSSKQLCQLLQCCHVDSYWRSQMKLPSCKLFIAFWWRLGKCLEQCSLYLGQILFFLHLHLQINIKCTTSQ